MQLAFDIDTADNAKAVFVLAHGAGAGKDHCFLIELSALLQERGISVVRFNFPYMEKIIQAGKRRPPDKFPSLVEYYQHLLPQIMACFGDDMPIFIGGKSMGSRVAVTLLEQTQHNNIKGGICMGYPFHPQKKPEKLRLSPLQNTLLPVLICQGTRDLLGNKDEIALYEFSSRCELAFLPDGDHDLKPRVKSGFTHQQHKETTANFIKEFILEQI